MTKINRFQLIYFAQYAIMSILMTQIVPYLTEIGYDSITRGWLLASYSITTIIFQVMIGYFSDKSKQIKKFYLWVTVFLVLFSVAFYLLKQPVFLFHLVTLAIAGGLCNTSATLIDNWVIANKNLTNRLASLKANGSFGWSIMSLLVPFFIIENDYRYLGIPLLFFLFIHLIISNKQSDPDFELTEKKAGFQHPSVKWADIMKLCKNRVFLFYNVIFFILYLTIVANNTLIIDKLLSFPKGNTFVGLKWAIQAFCEIPAYIILNRVVSKWKHERLISIAGFFLVIQFLLYFLSNNLSLLLAATFLQFFTVPTFTIGSRMIITEITPRDVFSSGQLISVSFYIGIASFVSPVLSGVLLKYLSINQAVLIFGLLPLGALALQKMVYFKGRNHGNVS